jgi:uncharacterized protein (TIGR03435 family)
MKWALVLIGAVLLRQPCAAQSAAPSAAFDVASVKFTSHGRNSDGLSISYVKIASPGRLIAINASLRECIEWAYDVKDYQVAGPAWIRSSDEAGYGIEAKAPPETGRGQIRLTLQTLLQERRQLKLHREERLLPVYLLEVTKNGPRLHASTEPAGSLWSHGGSDGVHVNGNSATMKSVADRLSHDLDRPVLDRTSISGTYRIELQWAREGEGPSVFAAVEEQLGLKLQASKSPFDILVIDFVQRTPAEN